MVWLVDVDGTPLYTTLSREFAPRHSWTAHTELADMVAAGMTPMQALVAATRTSAALLKLDQLGTVAEGKSADFVVLDADPLDDITNTRKIAGVYLRGQKVDRAAVVR